MSKGKTNIYGPRPTTCGFRCRTCGTEAPPLLGYEHRHHCPTRDATFCPGCLPATLAQHGVEARPTADALLAVPWLAPTRTPSPAPEAAAARSPGTHPGPFAGAGEAEIHHAQ